MLPGNLIPSVIPSGFVPLPTGAGGSLGSTGGLLGGSGDGLGLGAGLVLSGASKF